MNQSSMDTAKLNNSPWTHTGCFLQRHWLFLLSGLFLFFWIYRSHYYSGDGDQLSRMVEAGLWMVQTELASQAIFQLFYQILSPYGWTGLNVINLVSCLAGAVAIGVLIRFNRDFIRVDILWPLGLFFSSGFFLFCNGHTEYYTLFLATLFYYGYAGVSYLRGTGSLFHAAFAYSTAVWMHLGILFAFPSLLLLLVLKWNQKELPGFFYGLLFLVAAFFMKEYYYLLGVEVQGLSPSSNYIPLFYDPSGERFYTMFEWGHLADIIYAWLARSWIFWPAILWGISLEGIRSVCKPERLFLFAYTLCFTGFTLVWHPNLGIHQDWDLFAIEAAPCLLLLLTYLPTILRNSFRRRALAAPVIASILIMFASVKNEAHFERRHYGSLQIDLSQPVETSVTLNGHMKSESIPSLREGVYSVKAIDTDHFRVHDFYVWIAPDRETVVPLQTGPEEGRGRPASRFH